MAINTNKLKTFAQNSRDILIEGVIQRIAFWGFSNKGDIIEEPQRVEGGILHRGKIFDNPGWYEMYCRLKSAIRKKGVKQVAEEAAYTWFNRIMAIRILSKNRYLQPLVEFGEGGVTPLILQYARRGQANFLNQNENERLNAIVTDYQKENEAFAILLIGFCNNNNLLKNIFGTLDDFSELLLPVNILAENGFVHLLNKTDAISDEDYRQVELIGWLYQFYISKKKDEVFKAFKNNKKAEKEDIPAATQIFTPNWIVKYMVQNTVGQLWLDLHPHSPLKEKMKYLVEPAEGNPIAEPIIKEAADLKILDPASGSGHILVEAFDLLFEMYKEEYYTDQDAVLSILEKNIYGLDIDRRAVQLGQFAVLLKAAAKWPGVLENGILPMVFAMPEPYDFTRQEVLDFLGTNGTQYEEKLSAALRLMQDAQNLGSVMIFDLPEAAIDFIHKRYHELKNRARSFNEEIAYKNLQPYLNIILVLIHKFPAIAANPPYMGSHNMNSNLKKHLDDNYPLTANDLSSVFMEMSFNHIDKHGVFSMINQTSWMLKPTYKDFRNKIINELSNSFHLASLLYLGPNVFDEIKGEVVQSVCFTVKKKNQGLSKLFKINQLKSSSEKEHSFIDRTSKVFISNVKEFDVFSGKQFGFWLNKVLLDNFDKLPIKKFGDARQGIKTGNNPFFIKYWHEISFKLYEKKWFPVEKGGNFRKWYGNNIFVLNWKNDGYEIKNFNDVNGRLKSRPQNIQYFFKLGATWSTSAGEKPSFRYSSEKFAFESSGSKFFLNNNNLSIYEFLGFFNSPVTKYIIEIFAPGIGFSEGSINALPYIKISNNSQVIERASECVSMSKKDWDSMEISWDFKYQLLCHKLNSLKEAYYNWELEATIDFFHLHNNEEHLNHIFIEIYSLQDELTPDVALNELTILQEELDRDALEHNQGAILAGYKKWKEEGEIKPITEYVQLPIKKEVVMQQLISYAIGTMMGRYRLDKPGLQIAHPDPKKEEVCTYQYNGKEYEIDKDGIIPFMGSGCTFADDAYNRMKYFIEVVWGEETLTKNINFLEECLETSLEKYLVKDFWGNHCKMYSKRPIYWLFSSKKGAFQVLVYMHRMNKFICEKIRSIYLLKHIQNINNQILSMSQDTSSLGRSEMKRLEQLKKDLDECNEYDLYLKDIADKQIEFDLDDGVVENYKLFKGVMAPIK